MVREPNAWALSYYLHFFKSHARPPPLLRWLNSSLDSCAPLRRATAPIARTRRGAGVARSSPCEGALKHWYPFPDAAAPDASCAGVKRRWVSTGVVPLVAERWRESAMLLSRLLGREGSLSAYLDLPRRNVRSQTAYRTQLSLEEASALGEATASASCLASLYDALRERFEMEAERVSASYTTHE